MLKHEDIIKQLSKEEKIQIITNFSNLNRQKIKDELQFISQKVSLGGLYFNGSPLPDIGKVSSSFNDDLIYKYSSFLGYIAYRSNYKFLVSPSLNVFNHKNLISREPYLNKKILNSFIKGLNDNSIIPLINYYDNETDFKQEEFIHMNEYLQIIYALKDNELPFCLYDNRTNKYKTNAANQEIVKAGYDRLFFNNICSENQPLNNISLNKGLINDYHNSDADIDNILDQLLDYLLINNHLEEKDYDYNKLINELVVESTVLLKNKSVLPLKGKHKVAFFLQDNNITDVDFQDFNDDLDVKVFTSIPDVSLKDKFDLLILLVHDSKDVDRLYKELHHLFNAHNRDIKIMVVLTTNDVIDTSFDKYADVVIKTIDLNKLNIRSFMEILIGKKCPCGKLNICYPVDGYDYTGNEMLIEKDIKYPFGYGLGYGKLTYEDIKYDKNKITLTVKNEDKTCVSDVIQVYMENQRWLGEKHLIYYKKVYLKPNQSQNIEIVLTYDMFKRYNKESAENRLKKGLYKVYLNTSFKESKKTFLVLLGITKDMFNVTKFKNSAYVAISPRYQGKQKSNIKRNRIPILISAVANILFIILSVIFKNIIFIVFALLTLFVFIYYTFLKKEKVEIKTNDLDKEYSFDDLNEFDEYYKASDLQNDYVYDKSEIFKEERKRETIEINKEKLFYVKEDSDYKHLFDQLYSYLLNNGIRINGKDFLDVFGCICSSRVLYVDYNNEKLFKKFVYLLNQFFNGIDFNFIDLKTSINVANQNQQYMIFTLYNDVDANIKEINNDCKFDTMKFNVNIGGNNMELSKNLWYLIPYNSFNLANYDFTAIVIKLDFIEVSEENLPIDENIHPYFETFNEYLDNLSDRYYLDEEVYKKFDDLAIYMKNNASYKYFNKLVNHFERFVALNLLCKNSTYVTLDNVFYFKLVYYISRHNHKHLEGMYKKDDIIEKLQEFFGDEYLERTFKLVNSTDFGELYHE